jgi:hypothetical protein
MDTDILHYSCTKGCEENQFAHFGARPYPVEGAGGLSN